LSLNSKRGLIETLQDILEAIGSFLASNSPWESLGGGPQRYFFGAKKVPGWLEEEYSSLSFGGSPIWG